MEVTFINFLHNKKIVGLRESLDRSGGSLHQQLSLFCKKYKRDFTNELNHFRKLSTDKVFYTIEASDTRPFGGVLSLYIRYDILKAEKA